MKASMLGIYAVLSTAAGYISSTPLGYVNCFDKQYSAKYYILQATNWLTHGYEESPRQLYVQPWGCALVRYCITTSGIFPVTMGSPIHVPLVCCNMQGE